MKISKEEARRFLIRYHNLDGAEDLKGIDGTRTIMERIGSIQYDPLCVVGRNADLVLQSRVKNYRSGILQELLYTEHTLVDGFDKEMCIYNAKDYPKFAGIRRAHTQSVIGTLTYRNQLDALEILDEVRDFVKKNGTTGTKDMSIGKVDPGSWGHRKLSSAALDYLYHTGELCVADKKGTQKYFNFTDRVLSSESCADFEFAAPGDFYDWYIKRRINCVGMVWAKSGGAWQGHYLSDKDIRQATLARLQEKEEIMPVTIEEIKEPFYMDKSKLELFDKVSDIKAKKSPVKFIAPLDNILWDRDMAKQIFDFEYRWEVYTPVVKRKYGYYVIPVMYRNRFIARFEPYALGEAGCFRIKNWWWEPDIKITKPMLSAIEEAMNKFASFLNTDCSKTNQEIIVQPQI